MTREEKAKAYDEALEKARKILNMILDNELLGFPDQIREIFPQLRESESEDERIREAIEVAIRVYGKTQGEWIGGYDMDTLVVHLREAFGALEKQKENPKSSDSILSDCVSDVKCEDRWHKVSDSLPDNGREVLAKDKLGNTLLARYDGEGWDVSVYDDEDYRCHIGISKWREIPSEKQKKQKPLKVGENAYFDPNTDMWFIKKEQKPTSISCGHENDAEWDQEDKEKIVTISEIIEHCTTIPYSGGTLTLNKEYKKELLCFIRTLRPSWKPSEEQMEALRRAVNKLAKTNVADSVRLSIMYDNLKKL